MVAFMVPIHVGINTLITVFILYKKKTIIISGHVNYGNYDSTLIKVIIMRYLRLVTLRYGRLAKIYFCNSYSS
jgi:hypothetical protein